MPRDARAHLSDVVEACEAIRAAIAGKSLTDYLASRLIRSAVEREFILIGEAIASLGRLSPEHFSRISDARRIVDFRNLLTHEYPIVDDTLVWTFAAELAPSVLGECERLLREWTGD